MYHWERTSTTLDILAKVNARRMRSTPPLGHQPYSRLMLSSEVEPDLHFDIGYPWYCPITHRLRIGLKEIIHKITLNNLYYAMKWNIPPKLTYLLPHLSRYLPTTPLTISNPSRFCSASANTMSMVS